MHHNDDKLLVIRSIDFVIKTKRVMTIGSACAPKSTCSWHALEMPNTRPDSKHKTRDEKINKNNFYCRRMLCKNVDDVWHKWKPSSFAKRILIELLPSIGTQLHWNSHLNSIRTKETKREKKKVATKTKLSSILFDEWAQKQKTDKNCAAIEAIVVVRFCDQWIMCWQQMRVDDDRHRIKQN